MIEELQTRHGRMFVPSTDAGQYWWLANTGASPEDEFIDAVCELLAERPRGTAIDVGANFGCWSLALANYAHRVIAIEPQKACADLLIRSAHANRLGNVCVYEAAAGAVPGVVSVPDLDMDMDSNFGGVSVEIEHHEQPSAPMRQVNVWRIDDLARGEAVSFVKADVEGYEIKVLQGARATIERCRPILFVEMDHPRTDAAALQMLIEDMGYATEKRGGNFLGMPL